MRYLKRMLLGIYLYLALFAAVCLAVWAIRGEEPAALIAGVFGAAGIESIIGGIMKLNEIAAEKAAERRKNKNE